MGKLEPRPRAVAGIGANSALAPLLAVLSLCAGCAHRDPIDTPVGWFHQLQGGAIARQRPPPPGINDPYPMVGTTPARAPEVASLEMRRTVTDALLRQRNLTTRIDADTPMPDLLPPRAQLPHAQLAPGSGPSVGSSATLDAASSGPAARAGVAGAGDADPQPELAMPALQLPPETAHATEAAALPAIPGAPPPPPRLRGLDVAAVPVADVVPAYDVSPAAGTRIGFVADSDILLGGQQGMLHALASRRGTGQILVQGYGDAASADPDAQAQAVSIASLRARAVARALLAEGVPPDAVVLRANAFGRGAGVSLLQ